MGLVCFNVYKFIGEEVDCSPAARRHARLMHETRNICRMPALSPQEKQAAYKLLIKE